MNNTDKALAELLGVGTDTIKSLAKLVGDNYEEIYSTLVKEYTFYSIMKNIAHFSILLAIIMVIPFLISLACYFDVPDEKYYKVAFKVCSTILAVLIFLFFISIVFSPVLAPNIHFLKELRG